MERLCFEQAYELPASPLRVWQALADTERLNRRLGLPATVPRALGGEPVRIARISAQFGPLALEWDEEPFEFVEGQRYWVRRRMLRGPLVEFNGGMLFEPTSAGCRVRVQSEFLPASVIGALFVRFVWVKTRRDCDQVMERLRAHLRGELETPFGEGVDLAPRAVCEATRGRLSGAPPALLSEPLAPRLLEFLATAGDVELTRIRPFTLARRWDTDRHAVLRLCLRAAWHGVLDLSWDLLCPNCRGAKGRWERLSDVVGDAHCEDCQIRFDADFDRAVEVTFRPNARYRGVDELIFCSGGPRNTPHVAAQAVVEPDQTAEWTLSLTPGRYRVRTLTASSSEMLAVEEGCPSRAATMSLGPSPGSPESEGDLPATDSLRLCAGDVCLRVRNASASRQQLMLERLTTAEECATAAVVTMYQEFRDLFSSEVLSPTTQLAIRTLPLMFTDLQGSTALYRRLGNAAAYALVRDHFDLLRSRIADHRGGIVKTIGDAVMAAFPTAADAVACALAIQHDLAEHNQGAVEPLRLKLGLHQGPCIAVRSFEDRLDYFGTTVNLAARTHQTSEGDDIVVTSEIRNDPDVAALLQGIEEQRFSADLKGIGTVELIRLLPRHVETSL